MTKMMVEIDIGALVTEKDKIDALYKAIKNDVLNNSYVQSQIRDSIVQKLVTDGIYTELETKLRDFLSKTYGTPESIQKMVTENIYRVSSAVQAIVCESKETFRAPVVSYLNDTGFAKKIGEFTEQAVKDNILHILKRPDGRYSECDCETE